MKSIFESEEELNEIRKRIQEIKKEKEDSYKREDTTPAITPTPDYFGEYCERA